MTDDQPITRQDIEDAFGPDGCSVTIALLSRENIPLYMLGKALGKEEDAFLLGSVSRMLKRVESNTPPHCGLCGSKVRGTGKLGVVAVIWREDEHTRSGFSTPVCLACQDQHDTPESLETALLKSLDDEMGLRLVPAHSIHDPGHA